MAVHILPVTILCLSIIIVIWTFVFVLKHGFGLTAIDQTTGRRYPKPGRVAMWWLFTCGALYLIALITNRFELIGVIAIVLLLGGIVVVESVGRSARKSDEEKQSCRSLKITSAVALITGLSLIVGPLSAFIFRDPESDSNFLDLLYLEAITTPFALGLIWESFRLWKKALMKSFQDEGYPVRTTSDSSSIDQQWWIAMVIGRGRTERNTDSMQNPRNDPDKPHLVKMPKRR